MRRLIDLGTAVATLELDAEGKLPILTIIQPETEEPAKSIELFDKEGLHSLRDHLAEFLDELDAKEIDAGA